MSPSAQGRHSSLPVTSAAATQKLATPETYKPHNFRDAKSRRPDRQCVTCGRRPGKNFLTFCSIGRVRSRVRPVDAAGVAAGPNALCGSGPNRSHALESALTHTGSPDPRNDRICITSSCPRQSVEAPGLSCCWQQSWFLERLCADYHGPGHACDLIGKRNSGDLDRPALHDTRKPDPPRAVLPCISDIHRGQKGSANSPHQVTSQ
jgi:hypothetical protein